MNEHFEEVMFRLRPGAVDCNAFGLSVGGWELLGRHNDATVDPTFRLLPVEIVENRLRSSYGQNISVAGKIRGLQVVADALNRGDVAFAQIATLHLKLPDPVEGGGSSADLAKRLQDYGWLVKDWDPDKHPRTESPPNPGWFATTDGGLEDDASTTSESSANSASDAGVNTTDIGTHDSGEQVAVLTTNFKYACRALQLDPYVASEILHQLKEDSNVGPADNCTFDTETGDVFFNGDHIGNLKE